MTKPDKKEEENSLSKNKEKEEENLLSKNKEKGEENSLSNNNEKEREKTVEDKLKETEEKLLRALADIENQRRRFEKERQEAFDFGGFNFARESLSLLDNIDRAITSFKNDNNLKNNKDLDKIIDGIEIVKKDLISIFKKNDIKEIECINKKFDPNFHQAMLEVEDNTRNPGTVVQEIQKGYMMKDRLLRPSLVSVTKKREEKAEKTTEADEKEQKK
ncbi:MAG: nucleotide exchange factor GrpE [Pelagibacteraceae bacterium]|jgi:molecular chaperone GrpE|nr:nucleotide exchange factor GrpE [Candidatus Pelagibacter sp.]MDP6680183.1 nucleotide exchange factor GrpE [Pelagibacteraceae bacterium]MDP6709920.1 nucleotide exchange factor GrpE [Pelagibacteraceae bacterium]|tara:strand:+ start:174 stop:824 length:651 start_codon:yes stop_codon:yes gene_type:complete